MEASQTRYERRATITTMGSRRGRLYQLARYAWSERAQGHRSRCGWQPSRRCPDYTIWSANYGNDTSLTGFPYTPASLANGVSQALQGPALPGLAQGQLIDRTYAQSSGGCTGDTGAGCVAKELRICSQRRSERSRHESKQPSQFQQLRSICRWASTIATRSAYRGSGGPFEVDAD